MAMASSSTSRKSVVTDQDKTAEKRDFYCWTCHFDGPKLKCLSCPRSYHRKCVEEMGAHFPKPIYPTDNANPNLINECPECQVAKRTAAATMKNLPEGEMRLIFMSISKTLRDGYFTPNPFYKIDEEKSSHYKDVVAKVVDVSTIEQMAFHGKFSTLEGFIGEARWILHNTMIVEGRGSREAEWARELMQVCNEEAMEAEFCPECYLREHERERDPTWFIKPCIRNPHVLAWAKTSKSSRYWPVKVMKWEGDAMTVHSFAEHRRYEISSGSCFLYSENPPKARRDKGTTRDAEFKQAVAEIKQHIKELQKVVGDIELADVLTPLKRTSLEDAKRMLYPDLAIKMDQRERNENEDW